MKKIYIIESVAEFIAVVQGVEGQPRLSADAKLECLKNGTLELVSDGNYIFKVETHILLQELPERLLKVPVCGRNCMSIGRP